MSAGWRSLLILLTLLVSCNDSREGHAYDKLWTTPRFNVWIDKRIQGDGLRYSNQAVHYKHRALLTLVPGAASSGDERWTVFLDKPGTAYNGHPRAGLPYMIPHERLIYISVGDDFTIPRLTYAMWSQSPLARYWLTSSAAVQADEDAQRWLLSVR